MIKKLILIFTFFLSLISLTSCISENPKASSWYLLSYTINGQTYYANEHNSMDYFGGLRVEDSTIEFLNFNKFKFKPYNDDIIEGRYTVGAKKITLRMNGEKLNATCFHESDKDASFLKFSYKNADYVFHNNNLYYLLDYGFEEYIQNITNKYNMCFEYKYDFKSDDNNIIHYGEIYYRNDSYYFVCKDYYCIFAHKFIADDNVYIYTLKGNILTEENGLKEGIAACSFDFNTCTYEDYLIPHNFAVCYN